MRSNFQKKASYSQVKVVIDENTHDEVQMK